MAAKCNITGFALEKVKKLYWGFACKDNSLAIIENYIEYLDCPTVQIAICNPDNCVNNPIYFKCNFKVTSITSLRIQDGDWDMEFYIAPGDFAGGTTPFTYLWEYNEDDFDLIGTVTDEVLKLKAKDGVDLDSLNSAITVTVTDANGCSSTKGCYTTPEGMECNPNFVDCPNSDSLIVSKETIPACDCEPTNVIGESVDGGVIELIFDDINNLEELVGDWTNIDNWNSFFNTGSNATNPFSSLEIIGNKVILYGATDLSLQNNLFDSYAHIVSIRDTNTIYLVGDQVFAGCILLESIYLPFALQIGYSGMEGCIALIDVYLPRVTILNGNSNFKSDYSLISINLDSCTSIPGQAFQNCTALPTISLPVCIDVGVTSFDNCQLLTAISAPLLQIIGNGAFTGCGLTSINLPSVTTIGPSGFIACAALTSIILPVCTDIADLVFGFCTALTVINIPSCTNLGGTIGYDSVFLVITGNNITLTIPIATIPDGDVAYLVANNSVTLIPV